MKKTVILLIPLFCLSACGGPDPKLYLEHPHQVLLQLAPGRIIAENLYAPLPLQTQLNIGPVETSNDQTEGAQAGKAEPAKTKPAQIKSGSTAEKQ